MNEQSHIPSTNNAHKKSSTKDNSSESFLPYRSTDFSCICCLDKKFSFSIQPQVQPKNFFIYLINESKLISFETYEEKEKKRDIDIRFHFN